MSAVDWLISLQNRRNTRERKREREREREGSRLDAAAIRRFDGRGVGRAADEVWRRRRRRRRRRPSAAAAADMQMRRPDFKGAGRMSPTGR